ncbi:hypothetical protein CS063_02270 [Sporanaerobium hydrogeniformans]|uniref:Uncharacterized protein n=1 Tax=Sporanaerobium hydrogeniformans TaxID=3072179 RepID=A0AC61DJX2_9FIRM|nr:insulinase family protein [Sporanaerobium hydrogeniformans]PHV72322.1 hypothetical protein CS063_02270 [Sporanaerobium hydrogeniformans]
MKKRTLFFIEVFFILTFLISPCCYGKEKAYKEVKKVQYGQDTVHTYQHLGTGAQILWIENDSKEYGFAVGVKTPTINSTGVNHIIEHAIFTGSEAYPSPQLFFEASAAYPSLYMNALTSSDRTFYPFSTPYMPCYKALVKIYLDSLFRPNFLKEPSSFYEEGFHYNPNTKSLGGVVYNEMKGAYGSDNRAIYRAIRSFFYRDTPYTHDSGGNPEEIPTLRYEDFVATYKKYYYPGNMQILFYGQVPIQELLMTLEGYLRPYAYEEAIDLKVNLPEVPQFATLEVLPAQNGSSLAKVWRLKRPLTAEEEVALETWIEANWFHPQSTFKKALEQTGLSKGYFFKDEELPYPVYGIVFSQLTDQEVQESQCILNQLLDESLDKPQSNSLLEKEIIKRTQFSGLLVQESSERGLEVMEALNEAWTHDKSLDTFYLKLQALEGDLLGQLKKAPILLKEADEATLVLLPYKAQTTSNLEEILKKADRSKKNDWAQIVEDMITWQKINTDFSLPSLKLQDFVRDFKPQLVVKEKKGNTYLDLTCSSELARTQLYYPTNQLTKDQLPILFFYSHLLNEIAKEHIPFKGDIETQCLALEKKGEILPLFKIKVLTPAKETRHGELYQIIRQELLEKDKSWYEVKRQEWLKNYRTKIRENPLGLLGSLCKGYEGGAKHYNYEMGVPFYEWMKALEKQESKLWIKQVKDLDQLIYRSEGVTVATTGPCAYRNPYAKSWEKQFKKQEALAQKNNQTDCIETIYPKQSIVPIQSKVDYLYEECTLKNRQLTGKDYVTMAYLTAHYLNPQIRMGQGAYGAGGKAQFPDTLSFYTYRDPDYKASLKILEGIPAFLKAECSQEDFEQSKQEALNSIHVQFQLLQGCMEQADSLERLYLAGYTAEKINQLQQEVITMQQKELLQQADELKRLIKKAAQGIATGKPVESLTEDCKVYDF